MSNSNLSRNRVVRNTLLYDRYRFCVRGYQPEFFCLRDMDHARIDHVVGLRRDWGKRMHIRQPGSWYWQAMEITEQDIENLHAMCDWLQADQRERKLVIDGSWFYIYTSDQGLVEDISQLSWLDPDKIKITEVEVQGQPNTVRLQRPNHSMRSYFRSILMDDQRRNNLVRVLGQQEHIRLSPGLSYWTQHASWHRTFDYHFIDHDDSSIITLLCLIEPRLIRRTLPIISAK